MILLGFVPLGSPHMARTGAGSEKVGTLEDSKNEASDFLGGLFIFGNLRKKYGGFQKGVPYSELSKSNCR